MSEQDDPKQPASDEEDPRRADTGDIKPPTRHEPPEQPAPGTDRSGE